MGRRVKKVRTKARRDPAAEVRKAVDDLHALAQKWQWRGRGGDARTQATARVLTALSWALLDSDQEMLGALADVAVKRLDLVRERYDLHLDPFARSASGAYERILKSVEGQVSGEVDAEARKRAAQWFVVLARVIGFALPALPVDDDEAAIEQLVRALGRWRHKVFDDAREQAESWTRCMAEAGGRRDAGNAAKHRMKKRPAK